MENQIERGAAGFICTLDNGTITVKHIQDGTVLHEIKDAKEGSWDKIWNTIRDLKSANQ